MSALDAVVLSCDTTGLEVPVASYVTAPPRQAVAWFSNCFPHFARGKRPPKDGPFDARGQFNPPQDGMTYLIECNYKSGSPKAWGGASGGPVFTGELIAGIIKGVEGNNGLERLIAVPAWKLVALPDFRAAVGLEQGADAQATAEWRSRLVWDVAQALHSLTSEALEIVIREFGRRPTPGEDPVPQLAEQLVETPELILTLVKARRQCRKGGQPGAMPALWDVEDLLLPLRIPPEELRRCALALATHDTVLVDDFAVTRAGAAIRIAALDHRRVEWTARPPEVEEWSGQGQHDIGAVTPGEMTTEAVASRLLLDLAAQKIPAKLLPSSPPPAPGKAFTDLAEAFRTNLLQRSVVEGPQYCIVDSSSTRDVKISDRQRDRLLEALTYLKVEVPELEFLELSTNLELAKSEVGFIGILTMRVEETADPDTGLIHTAKGPSTPRPARQPVSAPRPRSPSQGSTMAKTVVELDLIGYSDTARELEEHLGADLVMRFNDQIQGFVDLGLKAAGLSRQYTFVKTTGDGAIAVLDEPAQAHSFAEALNAACREHNGKKSVESAKRWFRIAATTGDVVISGQEIAGMAINNAVRLESAGEAGHFIVDLPTYAALGRKQKSKYLPEERIRGKRDEMIPARRRVFLDEATPRPDHVALVMDLTMADFTDVAANSLIRELTRLLAADPLGITIEAIRDGSLHVTIRFRDLNALAEFINKHTTKDPKLLKTFNDWKVRTVTYHATPGPAPRPPEKKPSTRQRQTTAAKKRSTRQPKPSSATLSDAERATLIRALVGMPPTDFDFVVAVLGARSGLPVSATTRSALADALVDWVVSREKVDELRREVHP